MEEGEEGAADEDRGEEDARTREGGGCLRGGGEEGGAERADERRTGIWRRRGSVREREERRVRSGREEEK